MKSLLRYLLINLTALWVTTSLIDGVVYTGGLKTLLLAASIFAVINILLVPFLKILFLPLNLLTLGLFSWVINVVALYALTQMVPAFKLVPYYFGGISYQGFVIPAQNLSVFWVAVVASFIIGAITHFMHWLMH